MLCQHNATRIHDDDTTNSTTAALTQRLVHEADTRESFMSEIIRRLGKNAANRKVWLMHPETPRTPPNDDNNENTKIEGHTGERNAGNIGVELTDEQSAIVLDDALEQVRCTVSVTRPKPGCCFTLLF